MNSNANPANAQMRLDDAVALFRGNDEFPCVVGPTASGKTGLAIALAKALDGEILSIDSVQIYRRFDIGSAKPTPAEQAEVPHHLIDIVDGHDAIDAGTFAARADAAIADLRARNKRPILVGGTFLWMKGIVQGLAEAPRGDTAVRAELAALAEREGRAAVWEALAAVDPASAARLHPNDFVRTSRALEVFRLGGVPLSKLQEEHGFRQSRYPYKLLTPGRSTEELEGRLATRAAEALASGWIDETRALLADGYRSARPMGSVGYREVVSFVDGALPEAELLGAIVRSTRVFVRRQRTWLRDEPVTAIQG